MMGYFFGQRISREEEKLPVTKVGLKRAQEDWKAFMTKAGITKRHSVKVIVMEDKTCSIISTLKP